MSNKRTMTVVLTIEVEALQGDDLKETGFFDCLDEDGDEEELANHLSDYSPAEIASLIPAAISHPDNEMFAGSNMFVKLNSVTVDKSGWTS